LVLLALQVFQVDRSGYKFPLRESVFGQLAETREIYYNPDMQEIIHFNHQKMMRDKGMRTVMNAPLLVQGKFVGALSLVHPAKNALSPNDLLMLRDVASCLAGTLHLRRLEESRRAEQATMRNLIHALIPKKVLDDISHHFDESEQKSAEQAPPSQRARAPQEDEGDFHHTMSGSETSGTDAGGSSEDLEDMRNRIAVFSSISRQPPVDESDHLRVLPSAVKPSAAHGSEDEEDDENCSGENVAAGLGGAQQRHRPLQGPRVEAARVRIGCALYAEDRKNVCIIFSDVVRFSRIVDGAPVCCWMPPTHSHSHAHAHAHT